MTYGITSSSEWALDKLTALQLCCIEAHGVKA